MHASVLPFLENEACERRRVTPDRRLGLPRPGLERPARIGSRAGPVVGEDPRLDRPDRTAPAPGWSERPALPIALGGALKPFAAVLPSHQRREPGRRCGVAHPGELSLALVPALRKPPLPVLVPLTGAPLRVVPVLGHQRIVEPSGRAAVRRIGYAASSAARHLVRASAPNLLSGSRSAHSVAQMSEAILNPTNMSDAADGLQADALRAHDWAGEPFLHPGEEPAEALAPGTARRLALDEALTELEAGRKTPSARWKVRFGLMLGLERILSSKPPTTASGTELRRHQIDALAGMLTELIAANQRSAIEDENGNGNGHVDAELEEEDELELSGTRAGGRRRRAAARVRGRGRRRRAPLPLPPPDGFGQDDRSRRLRRGGALARNPDPHPPPPPRHPVPERPDDGGVRRALHRRDRDREGAAARRSDHDPDLRLVRAPRRLALARGLPARDLRRGAHGARREDERGDPQLPRADLHRHDRDRAADREAGLGRLPRLGRRPPARGRRTERPDRPAPLPPPRRRPRRSTPSRSSAATSRSARSPRRSTTRL